MVDVLVVPVLRRRPQLDQEHEQSSARSAVDKMLEGLMAVDGSGNETVGVVFVVSGAAVVAICAMIVAWLKWRHPPKDG